MSPELRAWLERERAWGGLALRAIARRGGDLHAENRGLERFGARMALVELTGSGAKGARPSAPPPRFAATDPRRDDRDHLGEYVEARLEILRDVLAEAGE